MNYCEILHRAFFSLCSILDPILMGKSQQGNKSKLATPKWYQYEPPFRNKDWGKHGERAPELKGIREKMT